MVRLGGTVLNATAYVVARVRPSTRRLWRDVRTLSAALRDHRATADNVLAPALRTARRRLIAEARRRGLDPLALLTPKLPAAPTKGPPPRYRPRVDPPP